MKKFKILLVIYIFCTSLYAKEPNFLLVYLDDMDFANLDYSAQLPNIKAIETKARQLENFYSPSVYKAQAEILTGKYPATIKNIALGDALDKDELCIASLLKEQGYKTAYIGKWLNSKMDEALPSAFGFDSFIGVLDADKKWPYDWQLKSAKLGKFTESNIKKPLLALMLNENIIELPANNKKFLQSFTVEALSFIKEASKGQSPFFLCLNYASDYAHELALHKFLLDESVEGFKKYYKELDTQFAKILKSLSDNEILEDTVVIFISHRALRSCDELIFDSNDIAAESKHKLNAFVYNLNLFPELKAFGFGISSTVDLLPSVVNLAGVRSVPVRIDGVDLSGYLKGLEPCPRNSILYFSVYRELFAMREGSFKIMLKKPLKKIPLQYYNLSKDPFEQNNLVDSLQNDAFALEKKAIALNTALPKILNKEELAKKAKAEKDAKAKAEKLKKAQEKAEREKRAKAKEKEKSEKSKEKTQKKAKPEKAPEQNEALELEVIPST